MAPLLLPLLVTMLPMPWIWLSVTVPESLLIAIAFEVLKASEKLLEALPPLLAAALP
ncbi:MAG: hypothetical protein H6949_08915 [Zoogloeaceae bacterium]|nr:hypothetical protein [Zoogloeaceae bacterium]